MGISAITSVARAWVPMDDTHTMFVHAAWKKNAPGLRKMKDGSPIPGMAPVLPHMYVPNDTSWFGRWRLKANKENDYLMDRDQQARNISYTGIDGVHLQDQAITESMGGIVDHEHGESRDQRPDDHAHSPAHPARSAGACGRNRAARSR